MDLNEAFEAMAVLRAQLSLLEERMAALEVALDSLQQDKYYRQLNGFKNGSWS